ncbi:AMIN-like domain-containing (lipo)protein [Streptomyces atacamensis]|uniref:AMIN-like domain-containing (lipo)protein n=1 Tax=Streptomyces atacamensis TaxID=531966 RepID=UPI00399CF2F1
MPRRSALSATTLAAVLLMVGCGGGGSDGAGESAPTAEESASVSGPDAPSPSPEAGDRPAGAPQDASRKSGEGRWTGASAAPVLKDVQVSGHDAYDRISFEFADGVPDYFAEYVDTLRHGGLGEEVRVAGEHRLKVVFVGVTPRSTFEDREGTSVIREVRDLGVFEGEMGVGIGVDPEGDGRAGFRVKAEENRIVVDIAHGRASPPD